MEDWYYIGPDKTGFTCPKKCCDAFSSSFGSCNIRSCITSGSSARRDFFCTSDRFPTPFHIYERNAVTGNISIKPNPRLCATVDPNCATYTPSTNLNSAARAGSGCSQSYVQAVNNCDNLQTNCPGFCDFECGFVQVGFVVQPKSCFPQPGGICSCSNNGPSYSTCACSCTITSGCYQYSDPYAPCYAGGGGDGCQVYKDCPDGTQVCENSTCPCRGSRPSCATCEVVDCDYTTGDFYCTPRICSTDCNVGQGYVCECGQCKCNTSSTCCVGRSFGWSYEASTRQCIPCQDYITFVGDNCCDENFKRQSCNAGSRCCYDGRCYSNNVVCVPFLPA